MRLTLNGRRRVGKTFLVNQTFEDKFDFRLVGDFNLKKDEQLFNFHYELKNRSKTDIPVPKSWREAFFQLRDYIETLGKDEKHVVFFDEMPWLDNHKSGFLVAFEYFWNSYGASKNNLMFIVCGSATSWLVEKIDHNKGGLFNRQNCRIYLEPFTLYETKKFLESQKINWSHYDICECYMILGGIPYYLNMLDGSIPYSANIDNILFKKHAALWDEFNHLYKTLFSNSEAYIKVIETIYTKRIGLTRKEIVEALKLSDVQGDEDGEGAQIDMLIDRRDRVINVCEMKFSSDEYTIDKDYDQNIRRKMSRFSEINGTKKALQLTFVTTYGVKLNMYSQRISSQVTMDDLFEK